MDNISQNYAFVMSFVFSWKVIRLFNNTQEFLLTRWWFSCFSGWISTIFNFPPWTSKILVTLPMIWYIGCKQVAYVSRQKNSIWANFINIFLLSCFSLLLLFAMTWFAMVLLLLSHVSLRCNLYKVGHLVLICKCMTILYVFWRANKFIIVINSIFLLCCCTAWWIFTFTFQFFLWDQKTIL